MPDMPSVKYKYVGFSTFKREQMMEQNMTPRLTQIRGDNMIEGMTKEEFIAYYCENAGRSEDEILKYRVALPCACDEYEYVHWAMVTKDEGLIKHHMSFNSPAATKERMSRNDYYEFWEEHRDGIECTITPRLEYKGRKVKQSVENLRSKVLVLDVLWLMDDEDQYPGEFALTTQGGCCELFGLSGISWIASGDVTPNDIFKAVSKVL